MAQGYYLFPRPTGSFTWWWIIALSTSSQFWTSILFQELMRCLTESEMQVTFPSSIFIHAFIRFWYFPNTSNAQRSGPSTALLRTRSCHSNCAMPLLHFNRSRTIFSRTCASSRRCLHRRHLDLHQDLGRSSTSLA